MEDSCSFQTKSQCTPGTPLLSRLSSQACGSCREFIKGSDSLSMRRLRDHLICNPEARQGAAEWLMSAPWRVQLYRGQMLSRLRAGGRMCVRTSQPWCICRHVCEGCHSLGAYVVPYLGPAR